MVKEEPQWGQGSKRGCPRREQEDSEKWGDKKSDFMTLLMTSWLLQKCGPYMCREGPVLTNAVHTHMHTPQTHTNAVCAHMSTHHRHKHTEIHHRHTNTHRHNIRTQHMHTKQTHMHTPQTHTHILHTETHIYYIDRGYTHTTHTQTHTHHNYHARKHSIRTHTGTPPWQTPTDTHRHTTDPQIHQGPRDSCPSSLCFTGFSRVGDPGFLRGQH